MDRYSIARMRITALSKEKKRINKELKHFQAIIKEVESKPKVK